MDRASYCCMAAQGALLLPEPPLLPTDAEGMLGMGTPGNIGRPVIEEAVDEQSHDLDCTFLVLASIFLTYCLHFCAFFFSSILSLSMRFLAFCFSAASLSFSSALALALACSFLASLVRLVGFFIYFFAFWITFLALEAAFLELLDFLALAHLHFLAAAF